MPETVYFWAITLTWPVPSGTASWSRTNTFTVTTLMSRAEILRRLIDTARNEAGAPADPNIVFFTVEPDEVR